MSSIVNAIRDLTGQPGKEQIKANMELMLVAAKARIRAFRDELNEGFMNPAQVDKIQIPGIRAIRYIEQYHVASSASFNQQVADHLDQAVASFFSIGGKDAETKQSVQSGIKALISTGLEGFIGSTEAGETEEKIFAIVPENNAIVRADICLWKYHFSDKSLSSAHDVAVAYILCKSVVDHSKLTIDELIYLVSEMMMTRKPSTIQLEVDGDDNPKNSLKINVLADPNNPGLPLMRSKEKEKERKASNYYPASLGEVWKTTGSPPPIGVVEAYIDELIRVWNKLKQERRD